MSIGRRALLRGLGLLAPALGMQQLLAATAVDTRGVSDLAQPVPCDGENFFKHPEEFERYWEMFMKSGEGEYALASTAMDPDILTLRSPSLDAKWRMQRARNYARVRQR